MPTPSSENGYVVQEHNTRKMLKLCKRVSGVGSESSTYQKPQVSEQILDDGPRNESPLLSSGAQDGPPVAEIISSTSINNQEVDGQATDIALKKVSPKIDPEALPSLFELEIF